MTIIPQVFGAHPYNFIVAKKLNIIYYCVVYIKAGGIQYFKLNVLPTTKLMRITACFFNKNDIENSQTWLSVICASFSSCLFDCV